MNIVIRVDASLLIGTGHVMRCLTLSEALIKKGNDVSYICRELSGDLVSLIESNGYGVHFLSKPCDVINYNNEHCAHGNWLEVSYQQELRECEEFLSEMMAINNKRIDLIIVDHYAVDEEWHQMAKKYCRYLMQIDDLADRKHDCDVLLDQNFYNNMSVRYDGLISDKCIKLLGPDFSLLAQKYNTIRPLILPYEERYKNRQIVIFFGGIDAANQTELAVLGIAPDFGSEYSIKVIVGSKNPNLERIRSLCEEYGGLQLLVQVSNMEKILSESFLYIGAVGATTWERCACLLPGLVCTVADNQLNVAVDLAAIGSHRYIGLCDELTSKDYTKRVSGIIDDYEELSSQSFVSGGLVDCKGVNRVINTVMDLINE